MGLVKGDVIFVDIIIVPGRRKVGTQRWRLLKSPSTQLLFPAMLSSGSMYRIRVSADRERWMRGREEEFESSKFAADLPPARELNSN